MGLHKTPCGLEIHGLPGEGGALFQGDFASLGQSLLSQYEGAVQTIYLDPPYLTGKDYALRQFVGEEGWATGKPRITLPAYTDKWQKEGDYYAMMGDALALCHRLLCEEGSLFLHIDPRTSPRLRLLLDDIFGPSHFVNEIIWAYQTGGRSTRHFSRKHDVILFYRKSAAAYFNIAAVGVKRGEVRRNHMRRAVDEEGRAYRAIISQGKEYRYYDDDLVYPGDVWEDVSHLQQKDPQRTGYDNQKPLALLERILLATTRPGDLVLDPFAGSGTTGVAAARHGRPFVLIDSAPTAMAVCRKRLLGQTFTLHGLSSEGSPRLKATVDKGLGFWDVRLTLYEMEQGLCDMPLPGIMGVDQLSAGHVRAGIFHPYESAARSRQTPALPEMLTLPVLSGTPALLTVDCLGRRMVHTLQEEGHGQ